MSDCDISKVRSLPLSEQGLGQPLGKRGTIPSNGFVERRHFCTDASARAKRDQFSAAHQQQRLRWRISVSSRSPRTQVERACVEVLCDHSRQQDVFLDVSEAQATVSGM